MMTEKNWLRHVFILVSVLLMLIGTFNYVIDPYWLFAQSNRFNHAQLPVDLRLQKVNRITYQAFDYDTLILGSSRTAWMDEHDFRGSKAFNFSVYAMNPLEYNDYIEFAKKRNGKPFRNIILGIDFDATNGYIYETQKGVPLAFYTDSTHAFLYKWKSLLSVETLKNSFRSAKLSVHPEQAAQTIYVGRDNVFHVHPLPQAQWDSILTAEKKKLGSNYKYKDLTDMYSLIKKNNPDSRFYVFTTPVSQPLFQELTADGAYVYYERWVRDAVRSFGQVHHFMYLNRVTEDKNNFVDPGHYLPRIGTLIAQTVMNDSRSASSDFGTRITQDNAEQQLSLLRMFNGRAGMDSTMPGQ